MNRRIITSPAEHEPDLERFKLAEPEIFAELRKISRPCVLGSGELRLVLPAIIRDDLACIYALDRSGQYTGVYEIELSEVAEKIMAELRTTDAALFRGAFNVYRVERLKFDPYDDDGKRIEPDYSLSQAPPMPMIDALKRCFQVWSFGPAAIEGNLMLEPIVYTPDCLPVQSGPARLGSPRLWDPEAASQDRIAACVWSVTDAHRKWKTFLGSVRDQGSVAIVKRGAPPMTVRIVESAEGLEDVHKPKNRDFHKLVRLAVKKNKVFFINKNDIFELSLKKS